MPEFDLIFPNPSLNFPILDLIFANLPPESKNFDLILRKFDLIFPNLSLIFPILTSDFPNLRAKILKNVAAEVTRLNIPP